MGFWMDSFSMCVSYNYNVSSWYINMFWWSELFTGWCHFPFPRAVLISHSPLYFNGKTPRHCVYVSAAMHMNVHEADWEYPWGGSSLSATNILPGWNHRLFIKTDRAPLPDISDTKTASLMWSLSLCRSDQGMESWWYTFSTNHESVSAVNYDVSPCFIKLIHRTY